MIKLKFFGAAREVTGSMHLIEHDDYRLLLDCGMYQGKRKETFEKNRCFPFDPSEVKSIVLSHAHIDHCGNIPTIMNMGYEGPVYSTYATKDLCELMLPDSAYVQQKDLEYVNKKRVKQSKIPFEPLYTIQEAEAAAKKIVPANLGEYFDCGGGIQAYYLNAGHILGSSMVVLRIKENGKEIKIGFTGDLGRKQLPILKDPDSMYDIDYLICESTYGGKDHGPVGMAADRLAEIINTTYKKGGKTIIPVFAVERAQEVLYVLNKLFLGNKIPAMPVFVDSPLTIKVTEVFKKHSECFDDDMMEFIANNSSPFYLVVVQYSEKGEESMAINE
ncbi:MAG TPA: MBL fold metallo-hydrolase [bacterium]|nr:MBL fold metallo-hydrolase [bacterium]